MVSVFFFLFAIVHAVVLFAVARDLINQRREATQMRGKTIDVAQLVEVRNRLRKDLMPPSLAGLLSGADFLLLFFAYHSSPIVGFFLLLGLYVALAFVTYVLTPYRSESERANVPASVMNELRTLADRRERSILDTLQLKRWENSEERFLQFLTKAVIDPERRVLVLEVLTPNVPESIATDRVAQKVFFEGVVDLLSVVVNHEFFSPYRGYFRRLALAVSVESTDDIGRLVPVCVFTLEASLEQVRDVLQKGYDLFHLEKSFTVRFNQWKVVPTLTAPGDDAAGSH
jgi:hypothetical protein